MLVMKLCAVAALVGAMMHTTSDSEVVTRLRAVTIAEEGYFVQHHTYTTEVEALNLPPQSTGPAVEVTISFAGKLGWTGSAHSAATPGKSCVIYIGDPENLPRIPSTKAQGRTPSEEGMPICDD